MTSKCGRKMARGGRALSLMYERDSPRTETRDTKRSMADEIKLNRIEDCLWEIPRQGGMRVPGRIYANEKLIANLKDDNSLRQVMNVAHLPGIVGYSLAMPDIHWGYGFPIGGVAALDVSEGVISPGGVGYDIN
jgi:tRNA-splicing ligase RtcB (3'-phosphate/5'-hydroxy nucleic acid ligase)